MGSYKTDRGSHISIQPDGTLEIISPSLTKYVISPVRVPVFMSYQLSKLVVSPEEEDDIVDIDEIADRCVHCSCNAIMTNSTAPITCPRCGDTISVPHPDEDDDDIIDGVFGSVAFGGAVSD